jgi:Zn-dependent protease with chaperone function
MPLVLAAAEEGARRFTVHVTPEMILHSRIYDVVYFAGTLYGILVLWLIMRTGISVRLRDIAKRARWRFAISMAYFALLSGVIALFEFPISLYAGFIVPHQFGLTHQTFASWLGDFVKAVGVDAILGGFVAALALLGIYLFRRWWVALWLGSIPVIIAGVLITPLIVDPLFNDFVPLKDPVLRRDLLDMAQRAGIEGSRVYQVNKSKQTTTMNAYVTGVGVSKRIVMWDTLLAKLDHDEIMATMGHEMGHYVLHHLWKGIAFGVLISLVTFAIAQPVYERGLKRFGLIDRADPAALPILLLVATVMAFVLAPVTSGYSRRIEHEADRFGLELTGLNEATASSFVKFAEDAKVDPDPPRFIEWWRYSHPATNKRIAFALGHKSQK